MKVTIFIIFFCFCRLCYASDDIGLREYLDSNFRNINEQQNLIRNDISKLAEKIDKNADNAIQKNKEQDSCISDNTNQITSLNSTVSILEKILIGAGSAGGIASLFIGGKKINKIRKNPKAN